MERDDYIDAIRVHGHRLADAAGIDLAAAVPSCPDWTAADLVRHLDVICQFWRLLVTGEIEDRSGFTPRPDVADGVLVTTFRADLDALVDALAPLDPATPCWTWADQHDIGFVQRRMAQEFAVHDWDAERAAGRTEAIEPSLAIDGIDEYLDVFVPRKGGHADGEPLTAHLHATDCEGEWVAHTGAGRWNVRRAHARGDVAVRATASDLLLMLWGRRRPEGDGFAVFGEPEVLDGFLDRISPG